MPLLLYFSNPFAALNVVSVPVGPSGFYLLRVHPSTSNTLVHSPPLPLSNFWSAPMWVPRSFASRVSGSHVLLYFCLCAPDSTFPVLPHLFVCYGVLWCLNPFYLGVILRVGKRPGLLHSLSIDRPSPFPLATWPCRRRSGHPDTPPSLTIHLPSLPSWSFTHRLNLMGHSARMYVWI